MSQRTSSSGIARWTGWRPPGSGNAPEISCSPRLSTGASSRDPQMRQVVRVRGWWAKAHSEHRSPYSQGVRVAALWCRSRNSRRRPRPPAPSSATSAHDPTDPPAQWLDNGTPPCASPVRTARPGTGSPPAPLGGWPSTSPSSPGTSCPSAPAGPGPRERARDHAPAPARRRDARRPAPRAASTRRAPPPMPPLGHRHPAGVEPGRGDRVERRILAVDHALSAHHERPRQRAAERYTRASGPS